MKFEPMLIKVLSTVNCQRKDKGYFSVQNSTRRDRKPRYVGYWISFPHKEN